jgi:hypothetical protein
MGRPRNPPPAVGDDLEDLAQAWAERGPDAIRVIREADPVVFFRMIARVGPPVLGRGGERTPLAEHRAKPNDAQQHHRPGGGLGHNGGTDC